MHLTTERLTLSPMTRSDAPFLLALMSEPDYVRHIGDKGLRTPADAEAYIASRFTASYERHGFGLYRVALRETDVPIGICGLVKRDSLPDVDLGFAFLAAYRSQGYASESAAAVMAFARDTLGLPRLAAITLPENLPSIRLLERLGFHTDRRLPQADGGSDLLVLLWHAAGQD
jgi:RimJ/RimL family protein N-acetyltransferase